jgi:hypothetical protein
VLRCSLDTRVLIGRIFTDLRHLRILLSKGRRMITLGMDPHPGSHTVAALNSNGSLLCSIKVLNTSAGLDQLHQFGSQFASRRWAIEGAGNRFVAQFVNELLAKGETIYAIAPSLTSQYRCRRRSCHGLSEGCQSNSDRTALLLANSVSTRLYEPSSRK